MNIEAAALAGLEHGATSAPAIPPSAIDLSIAISLKRIADALTKEPSDSETLRRLAGRMA